MKIYELIKGAIQNQKSAIIERICDWLKTNDLEKNANSYLKVNYDDFLVFIEQLEEEEESL